MEKCFRFELKRLQVSSLQHKNLQLCLLFVEELNDFNFQDNFEVPNQAFYHFSKHPVATLKKHENKFVDIIVQTKFLCQQFLTVKATGRRKTLLAKHCRLPSTNQTNTFRSLFRGEIKISFMTAHLHNNFQSMSRVGSKENKCAAKVLNRLSSQISFGCE